MVFMIEQRDKVDADAEQEMRGGMGDGRIMLPCFDLQFLNLRSIVLQILPMFCLLHQTLCAVT